MLFHNRGITVTKAQKERNNIVVFIIVTFLLTISIVISLEKFNTVSPFSSGYGLIKIMLTETEVTQIQKHPKVYLAKPDNSEQSLINFMKEQGYDYLAGERMSSILVFKNETATIYVDFSVNAYYSKWVFSKYNS